MFRAKRILRANDHDVQPNFLSTSGSTVNQISALLHQGVREVEQNHRPLAQTYFSQVLKRDPNNELALLWTGYLTEDSNEAIGYFDRVLRVNPANTTARRYYDLALARTNNAPTTEYQNHFAQTGPVKTLVRRFDSGNR